MEAVRMFLSNLKGLPEEDKEWELNKLVNFTFDLKINDFTQGILKETIYAIISTLKVNDEINQIKIKVEE